jgi:hypothetical protein
MTIIVLKSGDVIEFGGDCLLKHDEHYPDDDSGSFYRLGNVSFKGKRYPNAEVYLTAIQAWVYDVPAEDE